MAEGQGPTGPCPFAVPQPEKIASIDTNKSIEAILLADPDTLDAERATKIGAPREPSEAGCVGKGKKP